MVNIRLAAERNKEKFFGSFFQKRTASFLISHQGPECEISYVIVEAAGNSNTAVARPVLHPKRRAPLIRVSRRRNFCAACRHCDRDRSRRPFPCCLVQSGRTTRTSMP